MNAANPIARWILFLALALAGQAAESGSSAPDLLQEAVEEVERKKRAVEALADLEEALRESLAASYGSALQFYQDARLQKERETRFQQQIGSLPSEIGELRDSLEDPSGTLSTNAVLQTLPPSTTVEDLEQRVASEKAGLAAAAQELAASEEEIGQLQARPAELRAQQEQVAAALAEIESSLGPRPEGDPQDEAVAGHAVLQARKAFRLAESAALEQESLSLPIRLDMARARRDSRTRDRSNQAIRVGALEAALAQLRQREAEEASRQAEEAAIQAADKHPLVAWMADSQASLVQEREQLGRNIDNRLRAMRDEVIAEREEWDGRYKLAKERIREVGMSDSLAVRLLDQWRSLPDLRAYRDNLSQRKKEIDEAVKRRLELEDQQMGLPGSEAGWDELLSWFYTQSGLDPGENPEEEEMWSEALPLLDSRRAAVEALIADHVRLLQELSTLDYEENKLIELVEEYSLYLDERLLWIRSAPPIGTSVISEAWQAVQWLFSESNRKEIWRLATTFPGERPLLTALLGILLLGSVLGGPAMRRKEKENAGKVKRVSTDSFGVTLQALALLLLQSAPFAAILGLMGWQLTQYESDVDILRGIGVSLLYCSLHLFGILVLLNACRRNGLGPAHFQWSAPAASFLYRQLLWFFPLVLCCTVLIDLSEEVSEEASRTGLSRLSLIVLMAASAFFLHRILSPSKGILHLSPESSPESWLFRTHRIWRRILILIPLFLAVLSGLGYHHTTVQLTRQLAITVSFLICIFVLHQLLRRWFLARQRRLKLEQWLSNREASRRTGGEREQGAGLLAPEARETDFDVTTLGEQTRRFLKSLMNFSLLLGIWLIWSDVLPALNVLDSVELWQAQTVIDGQAASQPVTLNHLALALLVLLVMIVAVRNIGGALELGVLQNLPLEAGSRYAIVTVSQYLLVVIGTGFMFNVMGFTLAQFGWIMTALSVGLGFGLQEVVANFVSGIILLAERPIRVGDIVTVGDVDGVVSRIRIRATTITNWNRQELVVPNKEFITGRILNWTLSNTVNRIVIVVGVAYGTDTEKARQLLLKAASQQPELMEDPAPMATFEGFDDSSLRLILRCYLPSLNHRLSVTSALHTEIARLFEEAGIEISFPQQDINLRSFVPLVPPRER